MLLVPLDHSIYLERLDFPRLRVVRLDEKRRDGLHLILCSVIGKTEGLQDESEGRSLLICSGFQVIFPPMRMDLGSSLRFPFDQDDVLWEAWDHWSYLSSPIMVTISGTEVELNDASPGE